MSNIIPGELWVDALDNEDHRFIGYIQIAVSVNINSNEILQIIFDPYNKYVIVSTVSAHEFKYRCKNIK